MIERDPNLDPEAYSDADAFDLREALSFWAEPSNVDEPTEEQRLATFLEGLEKHGRHFHAPDEIPTNPVGRRRAPRLRLSLPARFIAIERTHPCILLNLSQTGAQIAILDSVREGEGGILECGKLKVFGIVARSEFSLNAVQFETEISDEQVLSIRRYHENFEARERRKLIETARKWATGETRDDRAM